MNLHAPTPFGGFADVVAVLALLSEFAMLRAPLLRSQVRLYAAQSLAVVALAVVTGITHHLDDLYVLAALSFLLKVVVVPLVLLHLLGEIDADLAGSHSLGVATMVLVAIATSVFGFFTFGTLQVSGSPLPAGALGVSGAVVLVAFVLAGLRADVVSQAIGFFSLENGVSLASMVIAPKLPVIVDAAFLFDLLVAVVVFAVLARVHHARAQTLSTAVIDRLKG
jgi:hydrogenase-4 component E